MNGDIRPAKPRPQRRFHRPAKPPSPHITQPGQPPVQVDLSEPLPGPSGLVEKKPRRWLWALLGTLGTILITAGILAGWYFNALQPVVSGESDLKEVTIASGSSPQMIGDHLQSEGIIRSSLAFRVYTKIQGNESSLQAGNFRLSPSESTPEIVKHLVDGNATQFSITFYPGATLYDPTDIDDKKRTDVYTMLRRAGFSDSETRKAIDKQYKHPLFAGKPANATLEGYVFGETYKFDNSTTAEKVLEHTFDVFYERIEKANILPKLAEHNFSLYQAITLASIIEREVSGQLEDQRIVSQIFHKRLSQDDMLGADATFQYVAQQRNVTPTITIESPYNTRIKKGLPPGPIATPSIIALQAAVYPADTDYLYFVSGDDGKNHFAKTNAEHVENTRRYCTKLCNEIAQ